jgi:hypothetical protein
LPRRGEEGAPGGRSDVGSVGASPANARRFPVRHDLDCGFVFDRGESGKAAALCWRGEAKGVDPAAKLSWKWSGRLPRSF